MGRDLRRYAPGAVLSLLMASAAAVFLFEDLYANTFFVLGRWGAELLRHSQPIDEPWARLDYADDALWTALPNRAGDWADHPPFGEPDHQHNATSDVFFVHPNGYFSPFSFNNANPSISPLAGLFSPLELVAHLLADVAGIVHGGCLSNVGRIYAPRYREVSGIAFVAPDHLHADYSAAMDRAYRDVVDAFEEFKKRRAADGAGNRPIILFGHSQGSMHLFRLLREHIAQTESDADAIVAAYLLGSPNSRVGLFHLTRAARPVRHLPNSSADGLCREL